MKNEHLTITIHDDKGIKQFNLHLVVKKVIKYIILFIFAIAFIGVSTILYLNYNIDEIQAHKETLQKAYEELQTKNNKLNETMKETQVSLRLKKKELGELSDSLREIENLIGLSPELNSTIAERVNTTKLSSEQRVTLLQFIPNGSPIVYKGITSRYGERIHPVLQKREFHNGSDMKASMKTPVYATADGIVEWSGFHKASGYGKLIILEHNFGFKSYYAHLNSTVVHAKQFVKKGDLIAYTGNSGLSSGPHLHYEIRYIYKSVNPFWFIKWDMQNYNQIFEKVSKVPWNSLVEATANIKVTNPSKTVALSQKEEQLKRN